MNDVFRVSIKLARFTVCLPCIIANKCQNTEGLMNFKSALQNILSLLSRYRKIVFGVTFVLVILLYTQPAIFNFWKSTSLTIDRLDACVEEKISQLRSEEAGSDLYDHIVTHNDIQGGPTSFLPYVGNGFLGLHVTGEGRIHVKSTRTLSQVINYSPIVTVSVDGYQKKGGSSIDIKSGIVHSFNCLKKKKLPCVIIDTKVYAHRTKPGLLIQELKLYNPLKVEVTVDLEHIGVSSWKSSKSSTFQVTSKSSTHIDSILTTGSVYMSDVKKYLLVSIATQKIASTVRLKATSTEKFHVITAVQYAEVVSEKAGEKIKAKHQDGVKKIYTEAQGIDIKVLRSEHTQIWNKLFSSGFGISLSKAPGVLNGDKINSTLYYVLSNVASPMFEESSDDEKKFEVEKMLDYPNRCYDSHHTLQLQGSALWSATKTEEDVITLANSWLVTLEKSGCASLLQAGADGVLQAMVLSFGGFTFKDQHLEFGTRPQDLHRDYFFRRINYGNNTHVNISVIVGNDNKASLYVSLDRNDRPYYACDAGCLDPPVKLSKGPVRFPVKLTKPLTAILYITADKKHMDNLKQSIHVQDLHEAPAHEHHVIALHRHGHHLGGLPALFWVSIAILVIIFHLFLFKLIFNEYCQVNFTSRSYRGKYNL